MLAVTFAENTEPSLLIAAFDALSETAVTLVPFVIVRVAAIKIDPTNLLSLNVS